MHFICTGANSAFWSLVKFFQSQWNELPRVESRNGPVVYIPEPVIVTYQQPRQRVLINSARDANPFFHLYEALWMLAGRDDVAPLAYYNSQISQYSDNGKTFNGAYGDRWRNAEKLDDQWYDQLPVLVEHLREKPNTRRAVLSMWNTADDLDMIDRSRDIACNLCCVFQRRSDLLPWHSDKGSVGDVLDMTVFNRSNDLVWGLTGANVCHFSILLEYVANAVGIPVGQYHQVTNNLHVYESNWKPDEWLAEHKVDSDLPQPNAMPLLRNREAFDKECADFVEFHKNGDQQSNNSSRSWRTSSEPFFYLVAEPMMRAYHAYKRKEWKIAYEWLHLVASEDWYRAGQAWVLKREKNYLAKTTSTASVESK